MCMLVCNSHVCFVRACNTVYTCSHAYLYHKVLFRYKYTWQEVGTDHIYSLSCIVHSMWSNYSALFRLCWKAVKPSCELQHGYN